MEEMPGIEGPATPQACIAFQLRSRNWHPGCRALITVPFAQYHTVWLIAPLHALASAWRLPPPPLSGRIPKSVFTGDFWTICPRSPSTSTRSARLERKRAPEESTPACWRYSAPCGAEAPPEWFWSGGTFASPLRPLRMGGGVGCCLRCCHFDDGESNFSVPWEISRSEVPEHNVAEQE